MESDRAAENYHLSGGHRELRSNHPHDHLPNNNGRGVVLGP